MKQDDLDTGVGGGTRMRGGAGAGQDGQPEDLALGAPITPVGPVGPGLGGRHDEGIRRHDHRHDLPGRAVGQGVRPLRYGARRDRRRHLGQPRLPARPLPHLQRAATAVHDVRCEGGSAAVDEWYAPIAAKEMADTHFCVAFIADPGTLHTKTKVTLPEDVRGLKIRPAQETAAQMMTTLGPRTCRPRSRRRATSSAAASPTGSPISGTRNSCSGSTT